jgi:hypothetical protein
MATTLVSNLCTRRAVALRGVGRATDVAQLGRIMSPVRPAFGERKEAARQEFLRSIIAICSERPIPALGRNHVQNRSTGEQSATAMVDHPPAIIDDAPLSPCWSKFCVLAKRLVRQVICWAVWVSSAGRCPMPARIRMCERGEAMAGAVFARTDATEESEMVDRTLDGSSL